ncbi:MAG: hypothetical protein Q8R37_02035 [Nanoarchaeota archaeon]|nr:hypothetical protein [Nanoarchaeota archaeon]
MKIKINNENYSAEIEIKADYINEVYEENPQEAQKKFEYDMNNTIGYLHVGEDMQRVFWEIDQMATKMKIDLLKNTRELGETIDTILDKYNDKPN